MELKILRSSIKDTNKLDIDLPFILRDCWELDQVEKELPDMPYDEKLALLPEPKRSELREIIDREHRNAMASGKPLDRFDSE